MTCSAYGGNGPAVDQGGGKAGRQVGEGPRYWMIRAQFSDVRVWNSQSNYQCKQVKAEAVGGAGLTKVKTEASTQQDSVPRI